MKKLMISLACILMGAASSIALNPALKPSGNFDLSAWKLQTLDQSLSFTEIMASSLSTGYTSSYFYTNSSDGSMVFKVPSNGTPTSGSSYPRVELRQMTGGANWALTDPTEHYLTAQCKVMAVAQAKPQTIIGQVHGSESNSELLKIRWTGYQSGQCRVEARYELNDATQAEYGVTLADGLSLGDLITYTISMKNGTITCTVNNVSASQTYTPTYFGTTDAYYFKAGNYLQYNPQTVPDPTVIFGTNQFYKLSLVKDISTSAEAALDDAALTRVALINKMLHLYFQLSVNSDIELEIYELSGRRVYSNPKSFNVEAGKRVECVNFSTLPSGVYVLHCQINGKKEARKIVVP